MAKRKYGEGTLRKRKDGRWEGRYTVMENGKQKVKYILAKTKPECDEKLKAAIAEYEQLMETAERLPYLTNPNPTFEEWSEITVLSSIPMKGIKTTAKSISFPKLVSIR